MNIKKYFMDILKGFNCRDTHRNIGSFVILKKREMRKHKNLKRFNIFVYGDSVEELYKNHKIMEQEIHMIRDFQGLETIN